MAVEQRTAQDFIDSLSAFVDAFNLANGTNFDIRQGTVLKDILIDAPSEEFEKISTDVVEASKIQSVNFASEISQEDLDDLGSNYGLTRNGATFSSGSAEFITEITPTANITINAGTIISVPATVTTPEIQFQTTQTGIIDASNLPAHEFVDTDNITKFRVQVTIQAVNTGAEGNTGALTVNRLNQAVPGITIVRNPLATTGGSDLESNVDFAARIQTKLAGNNVGTAAGISSLVLEDSRSTDVAVVGPEEPEMLRNEFGGSVDVYVLGSDFQTVTNSIVFQASVGDITLTRLPVISVASVDGTVGGSPFTFTLGGNAVFVKDIGLLADSSGETSKITFPTATKPDDGTTVDTVLTFDNLIEDLQIVLDGEGNNIVGSDILVRRPIEVTINVFAEVTLFSGFVAADVATVIKDAVTDFIDAKKLGESVNVSDLIAIIDGVAGVDAVDTDTFLPSANAVIGKNQVAKSGTVSVKIGTTIF